MNPENIHDDLGAHPHDIHTRPPDSSVAELLQEIRVVSMGVQVIFGFLLAVPFTNRFVTLSHAQRLLCLTSLILAALATALLLGPIAYHRLNFNCSKERFIKSANIMATCGLAVIGLAVSAAVMLVAGYVESGLPAVLITALTVSVFAGLWLALPLAHRKGQPTE